MVLNNPNMKQKLFKLTACLSVVLFATMSFTSCQVLSNGSKKVGAWITEHKPQINATGKLLTAKVTDIVKQVVIPAAISQFDKSKKEDFVNGLAQGFRTYQGTGKVLTSNDIQNIVAVWTPDKSHWEELGTELSELWATANPKTPAEAQKVLEQFAKGLNLATEASHVVAALKN